VALSSSGVKITAYGDTAAASAGGPCYDPVTNLTYVIVQTSQTLPGQILDLSNSPIRLACAGSIDGRITHSISGVGVGNYFVKAVTVTGTRVPLKTYPTNGSAITDSSGYYKIIGLWPAKYSVAPMGNPMGDNLLVTASTWPALSTPGDHYSNTSYTGFTKVSSGMTTTVDFKTLPMGSVSGALKLADTWSTDHFTGLNTAAASGKVFFSRVTEQTFGQDLTPTATGWQFKTTTVWDYQVKSETHTTQVLNVTGDGSGVYAVNNYIPRIAHKNDATFPLLSQYGVLYCFAKSQQTGANATPILVNNAGVSATFAINAGKYSSESADVIQFRPLGTVVDSFGKNVKLNQTISSTNYFLLHANQLCRLAGKVVTAADTNIDVNLPSDGKVTITYGILANVGGIRTAGSPSYTYVDRYYSLTANHTNQNFDTGSKAIPPNLGTDNTQLDYNYVSVAVPNNADLTAYCSAYTKLLVNNQPKLVIVNNPNDLTIQTLTFTRIDPPCGTGATPTASNVTVSNNLIQLNGLANFTTCSNQVSSVTMSLAPGQDYMNIKFILPATPTVWWQKYMVQPTMPANSNWSPTIGRGWPIFSNPSGSKYEYDVTSSSGGFIFNRILTGTIWGQVTYQNNAVLGLDVSLNRSGFSPDLTMPKTVDNACVSCPANQNYAFENFKFSGVDSTNFTVTVRDPKGKYARQDFAVVGWDLYSSSHDFVLGLVANSNPPPGGGEPAK
jgi:hypothetical protein